MGSLGMPEILLILVIALIIFGPRKLPELGKTLGQSLAQFRRASEDFKRQWEDEVQMEHHRIEAPARAPVEHESDSAPASTSGEEAIKSPPASSAGTATLWAASTSGEETIPSPLEEPSQIPTASETPVAALHEETAAKETKHDWM
jgi:TatA/E family protein of Tat protein translocase